MCMRYCVYLHGFLSSGQSHKAQWFLAQVTQENSSKKGSKIEEGGEKIIFQHWLTPTYPLLSPQESLAAIEKVFLPLLNQPDVQVMLAGSSMGGFYAQYLGQKYRCPYVMINPALNPIPLFEKNKGEHKSSATGEEFCIDNVYIDQLKPLFFNENNPLDLSVPALLLLDEADELIDIPFALNAYQPTALMESSNIQVVTYPEGNHAFQHLDEAWPVIKEFGRLYLR